MKSNRIAAVGLVVSLAAAVGAGASVAYADPSDSGVPQGFTSWSQVFEVQRPLNDAGREIQRVAAQKPGSGFTNYYLDVPGRSLKLYWRGEPSAAERQAIDAVRAHGVAVTVVAAKYSREQLDTQVQLVEQDAGVPGAGLRITPQPDGSGVEVAIHSSAGIRSGAAGTLNAMDNALVQQLPHLRSAMAQGGVTVVAVPATPRFSREADRAPFWGGGLIFGDNTAACTTGFAAERPRVGRTYMITASHCGDAVTGSTWRSGDGNLLGVVDSNTNARDAMFINTTPNGGSDAVMYDGPAIFVPGQRSKHVEGAVHVGIGAYVCLSGALTGVTCDARVNSTTVDCSYSPLGCVNLINALSQSGADIAGEGDSGGPVFVNAFNNYAALAVGLIHGPYGPLNYSCHNPLGDHYAGYGTTRLCSAGVSFTDVLDAVGAQELLLKTYGGQPTINGDDRSDLLARTPSGDLVVYTNAGGTGLGTFYPTQSLVGTGWGGFSQLALGDVNGDGRSDLLGRTAFNDLVVYMNVGGTGFGTFNGTPSYVGTGWAGFDQISLGDLNADGRADLLTRNSAGTLLVYLNAFGTGFNTFNGTPQVVGTGWSGFSEISLGDINHDKRADLMARTSGGNLVVYYNAGGTGLGTFNGVQSTVGTGWGGFSYINLADLDGDGRADLMARTSAGALLVYINAGGTGFGTFASTPSTVGTGWGGFSEINLG